LLKKEDKEESTIYDGGDDMTEHVNIKATKPMTSIYVALLLAVIALLIMSNMFAAEIYDFRLRIVMLVFFACALMMIIGAEIGRLIFKAGITPVGFVAFIFTNLFFIELLFASFVDQMGNDLTEPTGAMIGTLLLGGVVWYAIVVIWSLIMWIRDWRKAKESQT